MPPKTTSRSRKPELHDTAPKEVTTHASVAGIKTTRSRVFTRSPNAGSVHNDTLKRVTTPAGVAVVGTGALSFHPDKPCPHLVPQITHSLQAELSHTIWALSTLSPPTPGDPNGHSLPPTWPKEMGHHHHNAALPSRRSCSTPSGAAAPASADSHPCSEAHRVACETGRVGNG